MMEDWRANLSVETVIRLIRSWAATASDRGANLIVIATSGPCGQRNYLVGRWARVRRGAYRARPGRRGSRENRKALPDVLFVGCQQGFNKPFIGGIVTP